MNDVIRYTFDTETQDLLGIHTELTDVEPGGGGPLLIAMAESIK